MPLYRYKAVSAADEIVEGEMEAPERSMIVDRIHELGHFPLRVEEAGRDRRSDFWRLDLGPRRVGRKELVYFIRGLAVLLGAGIPLDKALEIQINASRSPGIQTMTSGLLDRIRKGASLGDSMADEAKTFPRFIVAMVRAGEAGGALEDVLQRVAGFLERMQMLREKVRSALIYPAILVVMAILSLVLLMTVVVPEFRPLFEDAGAALPLPTRIVVGISDLLQGYWWAMALILLGGALAFSADRRRPDGRRRWDEAILRFPIVSELVVKVEVARLARLLSTLLANGVALVPGLTMCCEAVRNTVLAEAIQVVIERVRGGNSLAAAMADTERFPALFTDLTRVGEETGQLDSMLGRIADIYDSEVESTVTRLMALLVPVLTIGLGILIAGIIASILFAVLGVNQIAF